MADGDGWRRRLTAVAAGAMPALVFALLTSGCGTSGSGTTITLYNAQHEQTTDALIAAFTKQTGIKVRVEQRRRGRPHRPDRAGGQPLPGRRVLHRELQLAGAARDQRHAGQGRPVDARQRAQAGQRRQRRLGRGSRRGSACSIYNPSKLKRLAAAHIGAGSGRPQVEGQDRDRPGGDRLLADRQLGRARRRPCRRAALAQGPEGQRRRQRRRPRQRDDHQRRQPGHDRPGPDQPLLLLPAAGRGRASKRSTPTSPTSPPGTRAMSRTSPARRS